MSKRVLIVDDSSMMRKMIAKLLQPPGHIEEEHFAYSVC